MIDRRTLRRPIRVLLGAVGLALALAPSGFAEGARVHAARSPDEIAAASGPAGASQGSAEEGLGEHGGERVGLSPSVLEEFGIEVDTATLGTIVRTVELPAEVSANQDALAHIAPRFAGIVKEVRKAIGDQVALGDTLAIVESNDSLVPYVLKSELSGVVIARHITRGEPVSRETQAFVVADLSEVWVDISVYQKDLTDLRTGQKVTVSAGHEREQAEGVISYIAPVIDEATRTATARVVLPNPKRSWRPGMFVTAKITVEEVTVPVAVPRTALEVVDGQIVVFVDEDGSYAPRRVEIGSADDERVEITSGLRVGERYVSRGGFTLKAELARDELSGRHAH